MTDKKLTPQEAFDLLKVGDSIIDGFIAWCEERDIDTSELREEKKTDRT